MPLSCAKFPTDLVVSLSERLNSEFVPAFIVVEFGCAFERDSDVSTFECEAELDLWVLYEMQCDFGVSFLVQVCDDALTHQFLALHDLQHFAILVLQQGELEQILRRIDGQLARAQFAVQEAHGS